MTTTASNPGPSTIKAAARMLLYGLAIWLLWTTVVITVAEAFPSAATSPLFASSKVSLVLVLVVVATLGYRRHVAVSTTTRSALVGTVWALVMVALDLSHYAMVPFDVGHYLVHYAPAYVVVPVLTALVSAGAGRRDEGRALETAMGAPVTSVRRFLSAVARRWPTALALVLGGDSLFEEVTDDTTYTFANGLPLLPLLYVIMVLLRRRQWTWPVLFACLGFFVALGTQEWVEPGLVVLAVALGAAIWGTGHGRHREYDVKVQFAGMAGFGTLALAGLIVDPDLGRYLVAAGWLGHGVWDFVHLAKDRVVARSFAEWCGVFDVLIGASLIIVPLL